MSTNAMNEPDNTSQTTSATSAAVASGPAQAPPSGGRCTVEAATST